MKDNDLFSGIVLFLVMSMAAIALLHLTWQHRLTMRSQIKLFLYAFGVRFLLSIVIYEYGLVNVLGDEDSSGWMSGLALNSQWTRSGIGLFDLPSVLTGAFQGHHKGYGYLVGALFYVTDSPARMPAAVLNCFFGALTVVFAYRIARTLFSEWAAMRVGWWTCFIPSMVIWSSQTVKEPVVILLETIALYCCVRLKVSGFSVRHLLFCALAIVLVIPFRFYAAYIAGGAVALALILPQFSKGKTSITSLLGVAALVVPMVVMSGVLVQHEAEFEKFDLKQIESFRGNIAKDTGSGVDNPYDMRTSSGFGLSVVVGGAHLLLAPFPWELGGGSLRMALTLPELLVWWWLFFAGVLPGMWFAIRKRFNDIQPMLFFLFGLGLLYSMMFGNIGLIYRQRAQLLPWLLIFAAVGVERRARRKSEKKGLRAQDMQRPAPAGAMRLVPQKVVRQGGLTQR
ncbi:MAG: hypothetical protein DMF61_14585 [Blastocatellia bacterium AA13]|nr:MAG: hypothetical protein DMF61_14585 [Blastocatellia bacterium AA13]